MVGAMSRNLYICEIEMLLLPCEYIFVLMNYTVNNLESFPSYQLHTVLIQGKITIFKDQLQLFVSRMCWQKLFQHCTQSQSANYRKSNIVWSNAGHNMLLN